MPAGRQSSMLNDWLHRGNSLHFSRDVFGEKQHWIRVAGLEDSISGARGLNLAAIERLINKNNYC
jgi:hypothetical protein